MIWIPVVLLLCAGFVFWLDWFWRMEVRRLERDADRLASKYDELYGEYLKLQRKQ